MAYDVIDVNLFHLKLMRFHLKKEAQPVPTILLLCTPQHFCAFHVISLPCAFPIPNQDGVRIHEKGLILPLLVSVFTTKTDAKDIPKDVFSTHL